MMDDRTVSYALIGIGLAVLVLGIAMAVDGYRRYKKNKYGDLKEADKALDDALGGGMLVYAGISVSLAFLGLALSL